MSRAASRERQRIIFRPWLFELLEDRALLAGLSGLHNIGPTGDYTSIGAAISSIQTNGLDGALTLELQPSYVSTVETFPIVFSNLGTTVVNTITLRPEVGATNLAITSADTTAATVDLNGAQYLTIDGRPGGLGATKELTIENTSTSGVALQFFNEASNNTVEYVTLRGVNTSATSGVVVFGTTTGPNGNDNNMILHCDIRDGVSTPANGVYSSSAGTGAKANSDNTIANSNIYNFYSSATDSAGVWISSGNGTWTIANNSFFQTASRLAVTGYMRPIYVTSGYANITENFIGGSQPNAGGAPWTTTNAASYIFNGIALGTPSISSNGSIQGNTIRNIDWTGSWNSLSLREVWIGIYARSGNVNIGSAIGNTIGSETGTGTIQVTSAQNGGTVFGIYSSGTSGTKVISNNTIGSITTYGMSDEISTSITGILVSGGTNAVSTVSNNLVGSLSTPNSLNAASLSMQTDYGQFVRGIHGTGGASITGNTIAHHYNNAVVGGRGVVWGIETTSGINNIVGNTVRSLSTPSNGGGGVGTVAGIYQSSKSAGQNISSNVVHTLLTSTTSASAWVTGIFFDGQDTSSAVGPNYVQNNLVHSLAHASTETSSLYGIRLTGVVAASNNIVRIGLDENGASTAAGSFIAGIFTGSVNGQFSLYNNSVFIGGTQTQTSGSAPTYAFSHSAPGTQTSGTSESRNNIFVNTRSNVSGASKHYAISPSRTSNNNVYFVSGTGGVLGRVGSTDVTTLADWQERTGQDAASISADPGFVNPTGNASTVDLHLQNGSPAINAGTPISSIATDFDGELRSLTTPDIGADELVTHSTVWNRGLFYNRSTSSIFGDGTGNPVNAIDLTKSAFLPGQAASFTNYTNYVHGLNGLIVDVANLAGTPTAADFQFDTWNGIDGTGFVAVAVPATVTSFVGGGVSGSTRFKIEFPNGAIKNTWLRVTMLANATTDLASDDVFYFGNAIGDMNAGNVGTPITIRVNATDTSIVRQNQSIAANSVGVSSIHDVNKDGRVNATDTAIIRQNQNAAVIRFFDAPASMLLAESTLDIDTVMADSSWLDGLDPFSTKRRVRV